jgi:hypothetical protein
MSTLSLRLPESLHRSARELAEKENISINQLITLALAEKIAALGAEEYLVVWAKRGSNAIFRLAMFKFANVEVAYDDSFLIVF